MLKELVRKITDSVPKPKPKPSRGCRYVLAKLKNNCTVAWDYGSIFPIGDGRTMTLECRDGHEGLSINGLMLP